MVKPTDIVDGWGDTYLGCPNCKEAIHFPLIDIRKRPNKCIRCGAEFDWSEYDAGQALESADNPTLKEA